MNIYITGIAGMLGSALARYHHRRGDTVSGCDIAGRPRNVYSRMDIRNENMLLLDMLHSRPSIVYHCAAMLGVKNTEQFPALCMATNVQGTISAYNAAEASGASTFVNLSSSEVYGEGEEGSSFNEHSPLNGNNVYARSKQLAEQYVVNAYPYDPTNMRVHNFRMFNCVGSNQVRQFFIPKIIHLAKRGKTITLFGAGETKRTYLYSDDAATIIAELAARKSAPTTVNIANTDNPVSLYYVARTVVNAVDSESIIKVRRDKYDDRTVARDIKHRTANTQLLQSIVSPNPLTHYEVIRSAVKEYASCYDEWDYPRDYVREWKT